MKKWFRGSTPDLRFNIFDEDGALVDPGTTIKLSIADSFDNDVVTDVTCTKLGTGDYTYRGWTVPATSVGGRYTWRPQTTDTAVVIENTEFEFLVMER